MLTLSGVGYTFDSGIRAIHDLSMTARRGEVIGIIGPSGCGKSTLLRVIAGLVAPTDGGVVRAPELGEARAVAMVFQTDTLLPWLTLSGNAGMFSKFQRRAVRRAQAAERADRTTALLDMVGLSEFRNSYPHQLSGGMRRRLAFITAVAAGPRVLLLDEPFASVDEPTRVRIHQEILQIIKQLDMTVVLVTHDLAEAISLADRVLIMSNRPGQIINEYSVPFGDRRDVIGLRENPAFLRLYKELWRVLSAQVRDDDAERPSRAGLAV